MTQRDSVLPFSYPDSQGYDRMTSYVFSRYQQFHGRDIVESMVSWQSAATQGEENLLQ